ncbi:MAG TPA: XRE family transcriptional regulator [Desulfobacteraceae bacterium]|nr:XRE family transcriptional regulator [Desulfobacteraceae bacterium]
MTSCYSHVGNSTLRAAVARLDKTPAEEAPAVCLRAMRRREGLTQKQLAERSGIPQAHISLMERGKATIGITRAKRLGKALNTRYKVFL